MSHASGQRDPADVLLETDRLVLRWFTRADLEELVALDADPAVMRFVTGGAATPRDEIVDDVLPAFIASRDRADGYGYWAAVERDRDTESGAGRFVGWFHLRPGHGAAPDEPELGYRLRRDTWGRGYATEGSRALIDHAFADLGAARAYAETMATHTASRRVMERVGMRLVRTFHADWPVRIDGDEHGDVEYAITRAEWEAARGGRA